MIVFVDTRVPHGTLHNDLLINSPTLFLITLFAQEKKNKGTGMDAAPLSMQYSCGIYIGRSSFPMHGFMSLSPLLSMLHFSFSSVRLPAHCSPSIVIYTCITICFLYHHRGQAVLIQIAPRISFFFCFIHLVVCLCFFFFVWVGTSYTSRISQPRFEV